MNNIEKNLEQKIMGQIKSGKVKLRSRYIFIAQNLGLGSAIVFSFILGVLLLSLVSLSLKVTGNLDFLSFGKLGWLALLESFPYVLIICAILFIFLVGYFLRKSQWFYKIKFSYLAIAIVVFSIFLGWIIAFANVPDWITEKMRLSRHGNQVVDSIILPRRCDVGRGLRGEIIGLEEKEITVKTPCGERRAVFVKNEIVVLPPQECVHKFIMAVGSQDGDIYEIKKYRITEESRIMHNRNQRMR